MIPDEQPASELNGFTVHLVQFKRYYVVGAGFDVGPCFAVEAGRRDRGERRGGETGRRDGEGERWVEGRGQKRRKMRVEGNLPTSAHTSTLIFMPSAHPSTHPSTRLSARAPVVTCRVAHLD